MAQLRWESAQRCYKIATFLVVVTMIIIALPQLGLAAWNWHIVGAVGGLVTILAVLMMVKGAVTNGLLSLVFAWGIVPGWIYAAPSVLRVAVNQYKVIEAEWKRTFGKPEPAPAPPPGAEPAKAKPVPADEAQPSGKSS